MATTMGVADAAADSVVNFDPEYDDLMMEEDDDTPLDDSTAPRFPKLKSAITGAKKTKGRGFVEGGGEGERVSRLFDSLRGDGGPGPLRSIEGWIILVTGVHEEAQEDDLLNAFGDFGLMKNLHLNLDRRTGYVKGYALIEYQDFSEARDAIAQMNGTILLDQAISVDWAFCNGPYNSYHKKNTRRRSRSPRRKF